MKYKFSLVYFVVLSWIISIYSKEIVYIIPPRGYENEKLFDLKDQVFNRDNCMMPFYKLRTFLRELGYDLKTTSYKSLPIKINKLILCHLVDDARLFKTLKYKTKNNLYLVLLEPPCVAPKYYSKNLHNYFKKVFIMLDDWVDNKKYIKLHYPQDIEISSSKAAIDFYERKLLTTILGNKSNKSSDSLYNERINSIKFFENKCPNEFVFFGGGWNHEEYPSCRGRIVSKLDTFKKFKFAICFENSEYNGYVTEKIFDCFKAGCVPIYLGAPNITQFIPSNCFIDKRNFKSYDELYEYIFNMNEKEYLEYQRNIVKYINKSRKVKKFSSEYFSYSLISQMFPRIKNKVKEIAFCPDKVKSYW